MIQINATDLSGFFAVFQAIVGTGPGTQASVVIDGETSMILAATPQGQLVATPVKTVSIAAPPVPEVAWVPEVVEDPAPEAPAAPDAPTTEAPAPDAPAAPDVGTTEAPTGDATTPTGGDPATT